MSPGRPESVSIILEMVDMLVLHGRFVLRRRENLRAAF